MRRRRSLHAGFRARVALAKAWSRDPSAFAETNERAVANLLDAARRQRIHRIAHNGTSRRDPPDELSFTMNARLWADPSCHAVSIETLRNRRQLFALSNGQVQIR